MRQRQRNVAAERPPSERSGHDTQFVAIAKDICMPACWQRHSCTRGTQAHPDRVSWRAFVKNTLLTGQSMCA